MEFVFNEWFLDWHRPAATKEEKRNVRRIFEWLLANEHRLVVLADSPFTQKLHNYRRLFSSGFTGAALKEFISAILLNSKKCRLLEMPPDLTADIIEKLTIGNFASDYYLFESAETTEEKVIVTTDTKLIKHFEDNGRFQLWSVEDFLSKIVIQ